MGGYIVYDKFIADNNFEDKTNVTEKEQIPDRIDIPCGEDVDDTNKVWIKTYYNCDSDCSCSIGRIEIFQDLFIIKPFPPMLTAGKHSTMVINKTGKIVLDFGQLDLEGFSYSGGSNVGAYEITNNKIILERTHAYIGGTHDCFNASVAIDFDGFTCVTKDNYYEYVEFIYKANFEIEYLGNDKFSDPKKIQELKFKEVYPIEYFE